MVARRAAQANAEKLNEKTMPDVATTMYQPAERQPPSKITEAPRRHNPPTQPTDACRPGDLTRRVTVAADARRL